ncbi:Ig domain-containing protein [Leptospira ryugenii]|uniref:Ig domain-containing protein n=1 Tax=Leptospira ryugenii TaxID=1917863 RepID=UPI001AE45BF7|nr:Ig domain-containing protein [Leptospira ryugenii]
MRNLISAFPILLVQLFFLGNCIFVLEDKGCLSNSSCSEKTGNGLILALLALSDQTISDSSNTQFNARPPRVSYANQTYVLPFLAEVSIPAITEGTPFTNCTIFPSPYPSIKLNPENCDLSGYAYFWHPVIEHTVVASNQFGTATTTIQFGTFFLSQSPTISYTSNSIILTRNAAITPIHPSVLSGQSPITCSTNTSLPAGLTISASTCVISGTPTTAQASTTYVITAANAFGSATFSMNIQVLATGVAPSISYAGSPFVYTQGNAIASLSPTLTGNSPTSCNANPNLPTGLSINNTTCVISGTPTSTQSSTLHTITASNAFGSNTTQISIQVSAATIAPTISYTGSTFTFTAGTAITTISANLTGSSLTSCSASPPLPAGLSLNNGNCAISGTPTNTQSATNYTIMASNGSGSANAVIDIRINPQTVAPTLSFSPSSFSFTRNVAITAITPTLTGSSPTSCSSSPGLPAGLSINPSTCAITGTPTANQTSMNYSITAANGAGSDTKVIQITVGSVPTLSYTGSPFSFTQNTAISSLVATVTETPFSACTSSPTLPAGLSINTSCTISGTPTSTSSSNTYTITATNSFGTGSTDIQMTVNASTAPPTLSYPGSPFTLPVNANPLPAWEVQLTGTPLISCLSTPSLPTGFSLNNTTCQIMGTSSTTFGPTNFTIRATNAHGFVERVISITVVP